MCMKACQVCGLTTLSEAWDILQLIINLHTMGRKEPTLPPEIQTDTYF